MNFIALWDKFMLVEQKSSICNIKQLKRYPYFYNQLVSSYPELTTGQLQFCAMLRLNFTTKEIANYTNISVRSVETRKNRLRKLMNIPSDVDLNKWMMDF